MLQTNIIIQQFKGIEPNNIIVRMATAFEKTVVHKIPTPTSKGATSILTALYIM